MDNNQTFSAKSRATLIQEIQEQTFDLLIIGGGITGAGIALDATTRGLKTLLIEKNDFAWGTSSRSTKLIHGGLRYLKQFEFGLVHEVGVERAIVHENAPHVVIPEKMLLPIIEDGSLGKTLSSIGLWVYDRLANVEKDERRQMVEKEKVVELEPLIRKDILLGGGLYYEYRTDDARLTIENIKTAVANGAICLNHVEATEFKYKENNYVGGVLAQDHISGQSFAINAKRVVNAAGPWVDTLRAKDTEGITGKHLYLTKGVHIVVPKDKLPLQQSVYFDVNGDGRMCFAIPRAGITYIGTTDTAYKKDINKPVATREDVEYILTATNYMFPSAKLNIADIESTWAGLRPLIHQEGKSPSELSRKDEIFYSDSGLISIAGGKLTGYRKMAERVVNFVFKTFRKRTKIRSKTKDLILTGGDFKSIDSIHEFIYKTTGEAKQIQLNKEVISSLVYRYGRNTTEIINRAYEIYPQYPDAAKRIHAAEVWYAIHYEMTTTLCDYLIRRTGRLYFERPILAELYPFIADEMAKELNWDSERKAAEIKDFEEAYKEVMAFRG